MGLVLRNRMDLQDKAALENAQAAEMKMKAIFDYNVMMGNLEDPDEEEDEEDE